ncbi:MAG: metallophosphoesterase [Cyanobacteria bacterium RYN_339]|nr:metallophosphoesterase [Cyanobacteria bacterium RYN_339]
MIDSLPPPCQPYLQDGRPGEVTLVWRDAKPAPAHLVVRDLTGSPVVVVEVPAARQAQQRITGLTPGAWYGYQLERPGQAPFQGRFVANRGPQATHLRFTVMGDMGDGSPAQHAIAGHMAAWKPEFVLTVGDNVYPDASAADFGPKFFDVYGPMIANAPIYPTLGNHDMRTDAGAPYLAAFVLPQDPAGERYYAFDEGPARFWALDSNQSLAPGSPQYKWLEADASASRAKWKIAFFHHPPYSSGLHGQEAKNRAWLPPLFSRLGFTAVFTGHDHHYERSLPIGGVTYFVTGGGGAMLYGTQDKPFTDRKAIRHEFLAVSIFEDRMGVLSIDEDGKPLDAAVLTPPLR